MGTVEGAVNSFNWTCVSCETGQETSPLQSLPGIYFNTLEMHMETSGEICKDFSRRDNAKLKSLGLKSMIIWFQRVLINPVSCSGLQGQRAELNAACPMKAKKKVSLRM